MAAINKNINYRYTVIVIARSDFDNSETGSVTIRFATNECAERFVATAKKYINTLPYNEDFFKGVLSPYLCGETTTENNGWITTRTEDFESLYNVADEFGSDKYYEVVRG